MPDKNKNQGDLSKKQQADQWVDASVLIFSKISAVENLSELFSLVKNVVDKQKIKDEDVKMTTDKKADTVTYEMIGKKLCLDIAHHVESAFKHYHPVLEINSPKDNKFCRVTIAFGSAR